MREERERREERGERDRQREKETLLRTVILGWSCIGRRAPAGSVNMHTVKSSPCTMVIYLCLYLSI